MVKRLGILFLFAIALLIGGGLIFLNQKGKVPDQPAQTTRLNLIGQQSEPEKPTETLSQQMTQPKETLTPPPMEIDQAKTYQAVLLTSQGEITLNLQADQTPITVNNFVFLAKKGFYDHTVFHRVIEGFMIQGGDPNGDGSGGPGYRFDDEPFEGEYTRGTIAMANAGPNTNGSQFFIMHEDYQLPKNYVIFGQVSEGMEVVDKIAESPVQASSSKENSKPVNPAVINSVKIIEN